MLERIVVYAIFGSILYSTLELCRQRSVVFVRLGGRRFQQFGVVGRGLPFRGSRLELDLATGKSKIESGPATATDDGRVKALFVPGSGSTE